MDDIVHLYTYGDSNVSLEEQRRIAVEAALELIRTNATSSTSLGADMNQLEHFTDLIQKALKPKKKLETRG